MRPDQLIFAFCLPCASLCSQGGAEVLRRLELLHVSHRAGEARTWLRQSGSDLVPLLITELDRGSVRAARALSGLRLLGPKATACLPKLVEILEQSKAASPAVLYSIGAIGRHLDEGSRREIRTQLQGTLRQHKHFYLPGSQRLYFRDIGWVVRALKMGTDASDEELIAILSGKKVGSALAVIELLRFRGYASGELITLLVDAIGTTRWEDSSLSNDEIPRIDTAASRALIRCAPRHAQVELAHARLLQFGTAEERRTAAIYLGSLGSQSSVYLRPLLAAMKHSDVEVARAAIVAVGACGVPEPDEVLSRSQLRKMLYDKDPVVVHRAVRDLSWRGPIESDTIPLLRTLSRHSDPRVAGAAKATLAALTR